MFEFNKDIHETINVLSGLTSSKLFEMFNGHFPGKHDEEDVVRNHELAKIAILVSMFSAAKVAWWLGVSEDSVKPLIVGNLNTNAISGCNPAVNAWWMLVGGGGEGQVPAEDEEPPTDVQKVVIHNFDSKERVAIGNLVRKYRGRQSQEAMAAKAPMSPVTWSKVEAGEAVRWNTYAGIEDAFGWPKNSIAEFMETGKEPPALVDVPDVPHTLFIKVVDEGLHIVLEIKGDVARAKEYLKYHLDL